MSAAKSSGRSPARTADVAGARLGALDAAIIAAFALFAALLMVHGGSRRGVELMPWPDGLEYAAMAANIAHGAGPVLHFGGYSYPARYTEGYPLILAAAERLGAVDVPSLYLVTIAMGLLALALIYFLTLSLFGRAGAVIATLMLALSPVFLTNSALVLSDVPTLAVTIYAACALLRATEAERAAPSRRSMILDWAIFGIAAGFTVM
ncbi:MAG TPA: glycosyltransferase family 39 protein, partial [Candidatus Binataceae bacterium]|nr:glycosyltransferase family 39 protein [Candidatus Binataceae bacterium]